VTVAEAYQAFLSVLEVNGFTVVPAGRYLKIVEAKGIERQTIPLYEEGSATPASDRYITRIHHLENVSADDVTMLLTRFKSASGNITSYGPTNMLIITDTGAQIRRMLRLVAAIDLPRSGTQTWIEPIHYANASEMAARLLEIFPADVASTAKKAPAAKARAAKANVNNPVLIGSTATESTIRNIIASTCRSKARGAFTCTTRSTAPPRTSRAPSPHSWAQQRARPQRGRPVPALKRLPSLQPPLRSSRAASPSRRTNPRTH
jgi:type II secretory pathway component GspD/PulD (secretin)